MNGILIPQNIFVGDSGLFLFPVSDQDYAALTARKFTVDIPLPLSSLRQNELMTVHEIRIVQKEGGRYLQISFVPWETGDIFFPPLSVFGLKTVLPSVHISSLLGNTQVLTLQPPKPPLLIPGTDYLLYGLTAGAGGFFLLIGAGLAFCLRKFRRKKILYTSRKRLVMLRRKLKQLYKESRRLYNQTSGDAYESNAGAICQWYIMLDRCVRTYLCALFSEEHSLAYEDAEDYFFSATYTQLTSKLERLFGHDSGIIDLFVIFYTMLEKQRFGSSSNELVRNYTAVSQDMLKKIPYIAEKTEAEYADLLRCRKENA
ncbi:MAG: hypothetical protein P1P65_07870 [Treponema sp.]